MSPSETFSFQHLQTNGISVRAVVEGTGPLVIMVHGFPELWYSWRHQIRPIAEAGFTVVAPDVRGYGGSDKPHAVDAYDMISLTNDVVGLIDALGADQAILIGHDWGAPICWNMVWQLGVSVFQCRRLGDYSGRRAAYYRCVSVGSGRG